MASYESAGGGAISLENLLKALKCTQELRASVSSLFEKLSDGLKVSAGVGTSASEAPQAAGDPEKEKNYLADFRESLSAINSDVEQLEKVANAMQIPQSPLTLGYLGFMTTDPFVDRLSLSQQVIQTYKWASKAQSQVYNALTALHSSMPKRSQQGVQSTKRLRRPVSIYTIPPQNVDAIIQQFLRYSPDLKVTYSRPFGSPLVLEVTCGRTMKAIVLLRGIAVEWTLVKAFHEDFNTENGKGFDLWSSSRYLVFRKITQHAKAVALQYGVQVSPGDFPLRPFLVWLNSYKSLFSTPCNKCGKILHDYIPPTWHEMRAAGVDAYHEHCRP